MWLVNKNGIINKYYKFSEAKEKFMKLIEETIKEYDQIFGGVSAIPFSYGRECSYCYENNITDDEIVFWERLRMLFDSLAYPWVYEKVYKSYQYKNYNEEAESSYDLKIIKENDETLIDLKDSDNNIFKTNAFDINDEHDYYFKFREEIIIRDNKNPKHIYPLGTIIICNINLKKVDKKVSDINEKI